MKYRAFILSLLCLLTAGIAHAATGINVIPVLVTNSSGTDAVGQQLSFNLSSQALVDGSWMLSTGLDTELQDSGTGIGYMPGTGQVRMLYCSNNAGVDQTTACNNATAGDITLPAAAAQIYQFIADNQFSHLWLNISTPATANWDIVFEYFNGVSYVAFSNVTDGTSELTLSGLRKVSWDFPAAGLWPQFVVGAVTGYVIRIRVSAFTSLTVAPLGQQAYYETGRWWTAVTAIADDEQKRLDLHLDTSPTETTTTVFSVAVSGDDATLIAQSAAYPPNFASVTSVATTLEVARSLAGDNFIQDAYLHFNTAALPDQISPDSALLTCHVDTVPGDVDNRGLVGDWYPWGGTINEWDYDTTPDSHALASVDLTGLTVGAANAWALQNLYQINKAGITGIRLSISGAGPTGINSVHLAAQDHASLAECTLTVVYNGSRNYHDFAPITGGAILGSGYALADNAALEPSNSFSLTIVGFFDASNAAATDILTKGAAIELTWDAGNIVRVFIAAVNQADCSPVTTGYHTLTVRQVDGDAASRVECLVDGVRGPTGISTVALTVANNATDWALSRFMPYVEYLEMEVAGTIQVMHQIRTLPTYQIINQANPGTFDANIFFPETLTGFTSVLLPLETTGAVFSDAPAASGDFVAEIPVLPNAEAGEHLVTPTNDLFIMLKWAADNSGGLLPYQAALVLIAFLLCAAAIFGSWIALHSVHVSWLAGGIASVSFIFVGVGIWGWMVPFSFLITGAIYIFYRRAAV